MNLYHRLFGLLAAVTLLWGCGDSSQVTNPQVVRRKIASESPEAGKSQQLVSVQNTSGKSTAPAKKETSPEGLSHSDDPAVTLLASEKQIEVYKYKGSIDPFSPLIRVEKTEAQDTGSDEAPKRKKRVPQTPLERIDLTQLKLTAVFNSKRRPKAMVEESSGKGYVVNKGAFIGLDGGQVSKILKDRIIITETSEDAVGKKVTIERELKLRQFSGE